MFFLTTKEYLLNGHLQVKKRIFENFYSKVSSDRCNFGGPMTIKNILILCVCTNISKLPNALLLTQIKFKGIANRFTSDYIILQVTTNLEMVFTLKRINRLLLSSPTGTLNGSMIVNKNWYIPFSNLYK